MTTTTPHNVASTNTWITVLVLCLAVPASLHDEPSHTDSSTHIRVESFDRRPAWDGYRHRLNPPFPAITRQRFGWSNTQHAQGKRRGEIGGWVQRSLVGARYLFHLPEGFTEDDHLEATGRLAVANCQGGSGVLIGWCHENSKGWRTPNSIAMRIDGNGGKYWLFAEYGTRHGRTGCIGAFDGERYQTTPTKPFIADGKPLVWRLKYDPADNGGVGEILFEVAGREYRLALTPDARQDGLALNRFGIWNQQTTGDGMEVWLDDLRVNGTESTFDRDPAWKGKGNDVEHVERVVRPFHQFGYSATQYAGGKLGEIGGIIWRDERPSYYASCVGPLTLEDELTAAGTLAFRAAGADSAVYLGWFDAESKRLHGKPENEHQQRNYLGVLLEGPSRVGHYFRPGYGTAEGTGQKAPLGPVLQPSGDVHRWSIHYAPAAADGQGQIRVTIDGEQCWQKLDPGDRRRGASFDRFGLFNMQTGGWHVEVYLDDLSYTSVPRD